MIYGKSELFRKLSEIAKKGWSNTQVRDLIDSLWRDPYSLRTSGFNLPGGTDAVIQLVPGFYPGLLSGSEDDIYSLQFLISPDKRKFSFYQYRYKLTYHKKTLLESVSIPVTEGLHFVYYDFDYDQKQETLHVSSPPYLVTPGRDWLIVNRCIVASVYYDAEKMEAIVFNDQRYGSEWNPQMHKTLRNTLGSLRDYGLAFTDLSADGEGDQNIHSQFGISGGGVWHGDIFKLSPGIARGSTIPIMYFNTADNPRIIENPGWAVKSGSLLQYQNAGILTDASEQYYLLYHVFQTNCLYNEFISVPGLAEYETLAQAALAMQDELENVKELLPYTDFLHIGTLIFQTSALFTNATHSRIVSYNFIVFTEMSVQGNGNLSDKIKLVNDQETPNPGTFYGAHFITGEKGFHELPAASDNYLDGASFDPADRDLTLTRTGTLEDLVVNIPCCDPSDVIDGSVTSVKLGYWYNWWAVTDARNIAPAGWHVPSRAELQTLETFLGGATVAGGELKETGNAYWDLNAGATNNSGFNGRGSGYRLGGLCQEIRIDGWYWSQTTGYFTDTAYILRTFNDSPLSTTDYYLAKDTGLPVRLIKDDSANTGTMTGNDGKIYPTVTIGSQVWMASNLMETKYRNTDDIAGPTFTNAAWWALLTEAYCIYEDNPDNTGGNTILLQHNLLGGLQGGNTLQRYHLSKSLYDIYSNLIEDFDFDWNDIETGVAQTYILKLKVSYAYKILSVVLQSDATMDDVTIEINGSPITWSDDAVSLDVPAQPAILEKSAKVNFDNLVEIGDQVTLGTSGIDTFAEVLRGSLRTIRV